VNGLGQYNAVKLALGQHETLEEIARRRGLALSRTGGGRVACNKGNMMPFQGSSEEDLRNDS
jgi:hypothetical protein